MRTTPLAALLSLVLAALPAASARADEGKAQGAAATSDEASRRFKSGVAFYKDKDFAAALVEFKRAYELVPNYLVLFNLGQTARELKDYAAALTAFQQYLNEGGTKIPAARRKEVASAIEDLRRKVGRIKVVTSVDGAEIAVDDVLAGVSPLASPVVANVGRHKVSATSSGHTPAQRVVDVASMEEATVTLDLPRIDAGPKGDTPEPPPPKPWPPLTAWVALSATGAAALATGVTGGLALSARSSLKTALATFPGNAKTIADAQGRTRTLAVATDVLGGITLAGAVTTTVLLLVAPRASEKAKPVSPTVSVSPAGVVVGGVF